LTKDEKIILRVLRRNEYHVRKAIKESSDGEHNPSAREVHLAKDTGVIALTDGREFIAINRFHACAMAKRGLSGFQDLMNVMLHEYLHDCDTSGSHGHNHEFYEAFHNAVLHESEGLHIAASSAFKSWCAERKRLTRKEAGQLDLCENG